MEAAFGQSGDGSQIVEGDPFAQAGSDPGGQGGEIGRPGQQSPALLGERRRPGEDSDWPWYRTLVRRVWEHRPLAPGPSSHDRFRAFEVKPRSQHPLVASLPACTVEDELYWRQHGDAPIEALLTAHSEVTGVDEPLAWAYEVEGARVVQSLLGHSAKTYEAPALRTFVRRVVAWCARRAIHGQAG